MKIVGIDEVGRGAWAGPLVVGAVLLDSSAPIEGLTDSKLLSKKLRTSYAKTIHDHALGVGLGFVSSQEVDALGLTAATTLGCKRALEQLSSPRDEIIIDGSINYLPDDPRAKALVKADITVSAVSAASIVAKVARDAYMSDLAAQHPEFGFEQHVGYGTRIHIAALMKYGVTPFHRLSFKPVKALAL